jgi:hypothetical protein
MRLRVGAQALQLLRGIEPGIDDIGSLAGAVDGAENVALLLLLLRHLGAGSLFGSDHLLVLIQSAGAIELPRAAASVISSMSMRLRQPLGFTFEAAAIKPKICKWLD